MTNSFLDPLHVFVHICVDSRLLVPEHSGLCLKFVSMFFKVVYLNVLFETSFQMPILSVKVSPNKNKGLYCWYRFFFHRQTLGQVSDFPITSKRLLLTGLIE